MQKSDYRYREEPRQGKKNHNTTPLNGLLKGNEGAQILVSEISKALPAIKKFSRENWKLIALAGAGITVVALGAYFYFNQENESATRN